MNLRKVRTTHAIRVTEISAKLRFQILFKMPYSAAWSATAPVSVVMPFSYVMTIPLNHSDQL